MYWAEWINGVGFDFLSRTLAIRPSVGADYAAALSFASVQGRDCSSGPAVVGGDGGVSAKVDCLYGRGFATYKARVDTLYVGVPSLDSRLWQARVAAGSLMECAQKQFFDRYDGPHTLPGELLASMVLSSA